MKKISCPALIVFVMLLGLSFVNPGVASAHTTTVHIVSTHSSLMQADQKVSSQITASYSGGFNSIIPNSLKCGVYRLKGWAGNLCVIVLSQCIGSACAPYAVDLTMDQRGINSLVAGGQAAISVIVALIVTQYPILAPYGTPISVGLSWAITQIGTYSRNVCANQGAGVYIGFPSGFSLHC